MNSLIRVENIKKSYQLGNENFEVLKWISLEINKWEFVSIMGQSWSWKSTLMNIIWMLDIPSSWNYYFNWADVSKITDDDQALLRRQNIGFIFQSYNLLPRTTAINQVMLPLIYQGIKTKERKERAAEALIKVWLWDKINSLPSELSGWQQQRIAVARAIVTNPLLILWDEPTWALDSKTWDEVMELISILNQEWKTVVIITHSAEINNFAKKHIFLKDWLVVDNLIEQQILI